MAKRQCGLFPPYITSDKQLNIKFLGKKRYSRVLVEINGNFFIKILIIYDPYNTHN